MKKKQKGFLHAYFTYIVTTVTVLAVLAIIVMALITIHITLSPGDKDNPNPFLEPIHEMLNEPLQENKPDADEVSALAVLFWNYQFTTNLVWATILTPLFILICVVILLLILLGCQMIFWQRDRRKLDKWREVGFMCERLEFLPASRIRLNNIELELNRTQIETLKKLAASRVKGEALHATDMGNHGAQSIKRLREELGARFLERSLVKARTHEGYWLETDSGNIHGLPDDAEI